MKAVAKLTPREEEIAMKEILKEIWMPRLTMKQRFIVWYFTLSFCSLCIGDESPIWAIALVVLNFANAARLIRKVPLPDIDNNIKEESLRVTHPKRNQEKE